MKTSEDIRREFIEFFIDKNHHIIKGTPLVPADDPTLLFTNAGMNQFKPIFLGRESPKYTRVVNSQRCMRVSGKHNDLEEVGFSPHHHTLFEMLGNWSFGDYYKAESIQWAWELLTKIWDLPKKDLWITVFEDESNEIPRDDGATEYWKTLTDASTDHIVFFGRKDNFWEMGETGPCGPCTEIHIDRGKDFCNRSNEPGHVCRVNGDCRRIVEIWNLVFIQYNRLPGGILEPLPQYHVDTGMGLERVTSIIQKGKSNYDTDLFLPIMDGLQELSQQTDSERAQNMISYRVIGDHIRAASFLLVDGVLPSNEWRGYVLRRVIRRAVRFGTKIGFHEPFLCKIADIFIDKMGRIYPELEDARSHICQILKLEEARFYKTLRQGLPMAEELITKTKSACSNVLPGSEVFKLYDTYGFPVDIIREIAQEQGLSVDENTYQNAMSDQKDRARTAWKSTESEKVKGPYDHILEKCIKTRFTGYETTHQESVICSLLKDGQQVSECKAGDAVDILIDPCPFYAESGGQVGDIGLLRNDNGMIRIEKTIKISLQTHLLKGNVIHGKFSIHDAVTAQVDNAVRQSTARNHTATHLLHTALRMVLGDHVKQSGSLVTSDRLRFDFSHYAAIEPHEIDKIEEIVNMVILDNDHVLSREMSLEDALNQGITALFGEKYGEQVRVIAVGDFSSELCGGTHVQKTGDIGLFKIISESSIAAGVRRIEAITGTNSLKLMSSQKHLLQDLSQILKTPVENIIEKVERMQRQLRALLKENEDLSSKWAQFEVMSKIDHPAMINEMKVIVQHIPNVQVKQLRELSDKIKNKLGSGIVLLSTIQDEKIIFIATVTKDLISRIHAGKLVDQVARTVGGGGGGRPDMAQAGGISVEKLDDALLKVPKIIIEMDKSPEGAK